MKIKAETSAVEHGCAGAGEAADERTIESLGDAFPAKRGLAVTSAAGAWRTVR